MEKIILRTKKIQFYFRGRIIKSDGEWIVMCDTYSGGSQGPDILKILDYKEKSKAKLLEKIKAFKSKHKLISKP